MVGSLECLERKRSGASRRFGHDLNRGTLANVDRTGFRTVREKNVTLEFAEALEGHPC